MRKAIVLVFISLLLFFSKDCFSQDCLSLKEQIQEKIESANYCEVDDDCIIVDFGCPFGCGSYLNKDFDVNDIQKDIEVFQSCPESNCEYKCMRPSPPICINNKCVCLQCEPCKRYKDISECECPEGTIFREVYNEEEQVWYYVCE
jgi:hypothetical protein